MRATFLLAFAGLSTLVSSAAVPSRTMKWARQASNASDSCDLSTVRHYSCPLPDVMPTPAQGTPTPPLPLNTSTPSNTTSSSCDLSQVQQPPAPTALPAPTGRRKFDRPPNFCLSVLTSC